MSTDYDLSAVEDSSSDFDLSALEEPVENDHSTAALKGETIVVDTRERRPYTFDPYEIDTKVCKLDTGDYTIEGHESQFTVERKDKGDFLRSITHGRERFKREIKRADSFEFPMAIVVEAPWSAFQDGDYYCDVGFSQIKGTVEKWGMPFNIEWYFMENRPSAEQLTVEKLAEWVSMV